MGVIWRTLIALVCAVLGTNTPSAGSVDASRAAVPAITPQEFRWPGPPGYPAALLAPVHRGQRAEDSSAAVKRFEDWIAALHEHEPGRFDRAAAALASWPDADLLAAAADFEAFARFLVRARDRYLRSGEDTVLRYRDRRLSVPDVQRLLRLSGRESQEVDVSRLVLLAVLLHTDVAMAVEGDTRAPAAARPGGSPPSAVLLLDGRQVGTVRRGPYWQISRSLLDLLPRDPLPADIVRRWYVATASYMQRRALLSDLVPHIRRARELFAEDAEIAFHAGLLHETLAAPHVQTAIRSVQPPPGVKLDARDARAHLLDARTAFGRAVEIRPEFAAARLRFGRVLDRLGRPEEAVPELARAYADARTPVERYYAALFLAGAQARLGQTAAARESFGRAAVLFPAAQAPQLGLSSLVRAAGDRSGAVALLSTVLRVRPDHPARQDPWWDYFVAGELDAEGAMTAWRASVPGRGRP